MVCPTYIHSKDASGAPWSSLLSGTLTTGPKSSYASRRSPPAAVVAFTIFDYQSWSGSVIAIGNLTTLELEHPWMGITAAEPILVISWFCLQLFAMTINTGHSSKFPEVECRSVFATKHNQGYFPPFVGRLLYLS